MFVFGDQQGIRTRVWGGESYIQLSMTVASLRM